jgi:hypothetical protein
MTHLLSLDYSHPLSRPKSGNEQSADTYYKHVDQLPPFNLTLLFSNELGYASYQRLLGVSFVDDGAVYSIQDQFSERTLVFLAEDFTELMPLTLSSLYQPKQRCVSARIFLLHQGSLSTGAATFPRASGPLLGTGPRLYEKAHRPHAVLRVPTLGACIDRGVAVIQDSRSGGMGRLGLCRYPAEDDDDDHG